MSHTILSDGDREDRRNWARVLCAVRRGRNETKRLCADVGAAYISAATIGKALELELRNYASAYPKRQPLRAWVRDVLATEAGVQR